MNHQEEIKRLKAENERIRKENDMMQARIEHQLDMISKRIGDINTTLILNR